jgi:hypothetical protein
MCRLICSFTVYIYVSFKHGFLILKNLTRSSKMKSFCVVFSLFFFIISGAKDVSAITLFYDDFQSYNSTADFRQHIVNGTSAPGTIGTPWYAAQFQNGFNQPINNVAVGCPFCGVNSNNLMGIMMDDGGMLFRISTVDLESAFLSFNWGTLLTVTGDSFFAGYYAGDLSHEFNSENTAYFNNTRGPYWFFNEWTTIASGRAGGSVVDFALPLGVEYLWIAFWMQDSRLSGINCAMSLIDNVYAYGNPIPEPGTMLLLGSGLLGLAHLRRRRTQKA